RWSRCASIATPTRCSCASNPKAASHATRGGGAASFASSKAPAASGAGPSPTPSSRSPGRIHMRGPLRGRIPMTDRAILERLEAAIAARRSADPSSSYVASLNAKGLDAILKKVGEEATEAVIAAKGGERRAIVHEMADLWFHCLVALAWHGVPLAEVLAELERREGRSGIEEKNSRPKG